MDAGVCSSRLVNVVLVPILKKGDLSKYDNWRRIALLDVVGKLIARYCRGGFRIRRGGVDRVTKWV